MDPDGGSSSFLSYSGGNHCLTGTSSLASLPRLSVADAVEGLPPPESQVPKACLRRNGSSVSWKNRSEGLILLGVSHLFLPKATCSKIEAGLDRACVQKRPLYHYFGSISVFISQS